MPRPTKPARLYLRKDEGVWIIIDSGKHIRTGCRLDEREEAEKALREYLNSKAEDHVHKANPSSITLGEILARYADDVGPSQKDPARTAYAIEALAPFWGGLTPNDVSMKKTREYEFYRDKSAWTVRRELGVLQAALNHAEVAMRLPNPPRIKLPKKPPPKDRWLTQEEVTELRRHAPPHLDRFILISLMTGRRKMAILNLRWIRSPNNGWVDLNRGIIEFKGTGEIESSKRRGSITMPKLLLQEARKWDHDGNQAVIHYLDKAVSDIDTSFETACRAAELNDVVPHTLKHTAITWAFQGGMTIEDATDYFATSAATLMEIYRQHSPLHQSRAVSVMDRVGKDFIADNVAKT